MTWIDRERMRACICFMTMIAAATILTLMSAPGPATAAPIRPVMIDVIDGGTIDIGGDRIRLVGFDTPETYRAECDNELALGNRATARLAALIATGHGVDLEVLPGRDRYGRGLGRLYVGHMDVADILIAEGLARPYEGGRREGWC